MVADILNGTFVIEVLGGNHTRQVLTELQYSENVPVVIQFPKNCYNVQISQPPDDEQTDF